MHDQQLYNNCKFLSEYIQKYPNMLTDIEDALMRDAAANDDDDDELSPLIGKTE
jgi:hypothetical protein